VISHDWRCVYIHQRKAAGHSIMSAFGKEADTPDRHAFNDGVLDKDWSECPRSYFLFSSVRNPFSRALSAWRFLWPSGRQSLEDVLRNPPPRGGKAWRHLIRPQVTILRGESKSAPLVTDDLIRVESLQADFDRISFFLGMPATVLKHLNPTAGKPYREAITPEARRLIEVLFAEDFNAFGYDW
jgi:hypothetical protein